MNSTEYTKIWNLLYIVSSTVHLRVPGNKQIVKCFFECLRDLFIESSIKVCFTSFFQQVNIDDYLTDNTKLFEYCYKLNNYFDFYRKKEGNMGILFQSLDQLKKNYQNITKNDWGNAFWFILHFLFDNLPSTLNNSQKVTCKACVVCIQKLIPCELCQNHMKEYMLEHNIDSYLSQSHGAFLWSWQFHNEVNTRLNKPLMDIKKAESFYKVVNNSIYNNEVYSFIDSF